MHFNRTLSEAIDDVIGADDPDIAREILSQNDEIQSLDSEGEGEVEQDIEDIKAKLADIKTPKPQPSASIIGDIV